MNLEETLAQYGIVHQRSSLVPQLARIYYDRERRIWRVYPVHNHPFVAKGESWWTHSFQAAEIIASTLIERDFIGCDIAYLSKQDLEQYHFYKEIR